LISVLGSDVVSDRTRFVQDEAVVVLFHKADINQLVQN
jgi:hypothetical protein